VKAMSVKKQTWKKLKCLRNVEQLRGCLESEVGTGWRVVSEVDVVSRITVPGGHYESAWGYIGNN
jgi:hypothetical protein